MQGEGDHYQRPYLVGLTSGRNTEFKEQARRRLRDVPEVNDCLMSCGRKRKLFLLLSSNWINRLATAIGLAFGPAPL